VDARKSRHPLNLKLERKKIMGSLGVHGLKGRGDLHRGRGNHYLIGQKQSNREDLSEITLQGPRSIQKRRDSILNKKIVQGGALCCRCEGDLQGGDPKKKRRRGGDYSLGCNCQ